MKHNVPYSLIAAMTPNNVIGNDNDIPWPKIKKDMKLFKDLTESHIVIMGRKTWESIPLKFRPLPNRINIVVSSSVNKHDVVLNHGKNRHEKTLKVPSLEVAFEIAEFEHKQALFSLENKKTFVIGGQSIYEQTIADADELHLSQVHEEHTGDKFFPKIDLSEWDKLNSSDYTEFTYKHLKRK